MCTSVFCQFALLFVLFFHVFSKVRFIATYMLLSYGAFHDALQQFICYCFRACSRPKITDSTVAPPTYNSARPGVWLTVLFWCVLLVIMDGMSSATAAVTWRHRLSIFVTGSKWSAQTAIHCFTCDGDAGYTLPCLCMLCTQVISVDLFVRCTKVNWQC